MTYTEKPLFKTHFDKLNLFGIQSEVITEGGETQPRAEKHNRGRRNITESVKAATEIS